VEFAAFYNDTLSEKADLPDDYRNWKDSARGFSFCNFPFLLTPFYKSQLLAVESKLEQRNRRSQAMGQFLLGVGSEPVLAVRVRREGSRRHVAPGVNRFCYISNRFFLVANRHEASGCMVKFPRNFWLIFERTVHGGVGLGCMPL